MISKRLLPFCKKKKEASKMRSDQILVWHAVAGCIFGLRQHRMGSVLPGHIDPTNTECYGEVAQYSQNWHIYCTHSNILSWATMWEVKEHLPVPVR